MNQKFHSEVTQRDDVTYIKLSGVIDEDNELASLAERLGPGTAIIDLAEVERINSCGVRDWVSWLTRMQEQDARVVLVECSPAIVAQINLVNNFVGEGAVKSFYAPYFCPSCDLEKVLLVELDEMKGGDEASAPVCRCDECDGMMDFDDMEESYFAFIPSATPPELSGVVREVISELMPEEPTSERKVRSRVSSVGMAGTGSGSLPSAVSLPSLPSVPSLPSLASATDKDGDPDGESAADKAGTSASSGEPAPPARQSSLRLVIVILLLLMAIGLLVYVIVKYRKPEPDIKGKPTSELVVPAPERRLDTAFSPFP